MLPSPRGEDAASACSCASVLAVKPADGHRQLLGSVDVLPQQQVARFRRKRGGGDDSTSVQRQAAEASGFF